MARLTNNRNCFRMPDKTGTGSGKLAESLYKHAGKGACPGFVRAS